MRQIGETNSRNRRFPATDDPEVGKARADMERYGIPVREYKAWLHQRDSARRRGIPFRFSLLGWRIWWSTELAKIGPDAKRGRTRESYVMARRRDRGAYEPGNVQCVRPRDNIADRDPIIVAASTAKGIATRQARGCKLGQHLSIRGDAHPRSRAVMTPKGRFGSIALAADAFGITRQAAHQKVRRGSPGWWYEGQRILQPPVPPLVGLDSS